MAATAGLIVAGTLAAGVGTEPAHAATAAAGTGWTQEAIVSQRNEQCAFYSAENHLAPIDSVVCSSSTWWWCRILDNDIWNVPGDTYECVDQNKSYMFGESGGEFKLETDSTASFIDDTTGAANYWQTFEYVHNDNYFGSGPAGSPLAVESSEPAGYGWILASP
jgi:hypothetical protein